MNETDTAGFRGDGLEERLDGGKADRAQTSRGPEQFSSCELQLTIVLWR